MKPSEKVDPMRGMVLLLLVLALPALADDRTWTGAGFRAVATSPTASELIFIGPASASVRFQERTPSGARGRVFDQCKLPCTRTPKGDRWRSVLWSAVLPDGSELARGVLQPKPQTAYQVMIARFDPALNGATAQVHRSAGLAEEKFQKCRASVERVSSQVVKMSIAKGCVVDSPISVAQLGAVVDAFASPKDKVLIVRAALEGLVDPEHGDQLLRHFADPADKQHVQALLDGTNEDAEP